MKLAEYIENMTDAELARFASKAHTSTAYLKQLANGRRSAGVKSIYNIERASGKAVTITDLRPDLKKLNFKRKKKAATA